MYEKVDFSYLTGLPGMSDALLSNHFALYEGYVNNTRKLAETLAAMASDDRSSTPEYAELKRRFGWEFNGMRLHEYYFSNVTKETETLDATGELAIKMAEEFGGFEFWEKDFRATGASRGIGWAVLVYDFSSSGHLKNVWIDEHNAGHLIGTMPLLVMDVFEHAFMLDYGMKRADYIDMFFRVIRWSKVAERYAGALLLRDAMALKKIHSLQGDIKRA
jgi:Fe-Mn family superoxide dismutase